MYLNKAILIGNLTRDPELKSLPSGFPVAEFGLATNRVWKDRDGNRKEDVDFHNIVVFGRQAETTAQYLKKGSSALIEGRIQTRSWDGQDGVKRYRTEIVADRIQFGPRKEGGSFAPASPVEGSGGVSVSRPANKKEPPKDDPGLETIQYPEEEINPDDIPF
ncbi:single-stranded DNA-binding protein [bacterium]|nr:single-stranded DNA-binding protein [bacterium]MCI0679778.1 single-stranded DNA-binding protein [bacterium]